MTTEKYVAIINTPGYLPDADDTPPVFDTVGEAWEWLAQQRRDAEDEAETVAQGYSATVNILQMVADSQDWSTCENAGVDPLSAEGTVYGPTPGYEGDHDLGLAYTVMSREEEDE
jgi:hypothetical protein